MIKITISEDAGITASLDSGICGCLVWLVEREGLIRRQQCLCILKSHPKAFCVYVINTGICLDYGRQLERTEEAGLDDHSV